MNNDREDAEPFCLEHTFEVLDRTPAVLRVLLGGLSEVWTSRNYGKGTFSPFDVVGHLLHADQTNWLPRLRFILDHGETEPFPPFDRYAMYTASVGRSIGDLLAAFEEARSSALQELRSISLTKTLLARRGLHPQLGTVTVQQLLASWVVHDLGHTHQIVKSMAYQYRVEVGPWREFLTILPQA